ncbi:MAG TPA: GAF domain-containing protein [Ktedonobacteraceae bacterium]|nr:GAF domain-containing protein [Ktedonobacteraceae bacterium]
MTTKEELEAARRRIIVLEHEVEQLRARNENDGAAAQLRAQLAQLGAASVLGAPTEHTQLLEQIVRTANHVLRAHAGTLYLVNENTEELVFEVALGERGDMLRGTRFPIGQGIAGWVAASGEAIAIADVQQDPQWATGIGQRLGYAPKTMLAMPLLLRDNVIGVLQLMDKDDGSPFSAGDMATLGLFAQQAAVAIAQSRSLLSLSSLLRALLTDQENPAMQAAAFVADTEESAEYRDTLQLAKLLGEIARQSDAARRLSLQVVEAIVTYLHAQSHFEERGD